MYKHDCGGTLSQAVQRSAVPYSAAPVQARARPAEHCHHWSQGPALAQRHLSPDTGPGAAAGTVTAVIPPPSSTTVNECVKW